MKDRIEYILFAGLSWFFSIIGIRASRKFAPLMAGFFYYIVPIRKNVVLKNLKIAFPDKSEKDRKKTAFNSYKNAAITIIEILCMPSYKKEDLINYVDCDNTELITKLHSKGNGLIVMSGHYGNWEFAALAFSLKVNIPFHVVVKSQRNKLVNEWMNKYRTRWINEVVPLGASIKNVFKELKNKNIVAMVSDQRGPEEGARIDFFGRPSAIYTGPAALAIKNNSPIVMGLLVRQEDYSYKVHLEEVSLDNLPEKFEDKVLELSRRHTKILEKYIQEHPHLWFWMHNRWKY